MQKQITSPQLGVGGGGKKVGKKENKTKQKEKKPKQNKKEGRVTLRSLLYRLVLKLSVWFIWYSRKLLPIW